MRLPKPLVFVPAVFLAVICSATESLHAADHGEGILMLQDEELAGAAAECGIGTDGERIEPAASAAVPAPIIGLGEWVAGLVGGHIKGVITRRLNLDQEYNRFLALSRQLRLIEGQLKALDEKFDRLGDQIKVKELRQLTVNLAERFVDPVKNGTQSLETFACEEAALLKVKRMGRDAARAQLDRDRALAAFEKTCKRTAFENIPRDLTAHFKSGESILSRYLEVAILPQRYLTHQDSQDLDDFFYRYHLIQIQALRLTAECELRFPIAGVDPDDPNLHESVADSVYRKPNSHYQRAQIGALSKIPPDVLPDDVIYDAQTRLQWWNAVDYGAHPAVNRHRLIQDYTISLQHEMAGAKGARRFELAKFNEVEKFAALGEAMPSARRSDANNGGRYPATLKPFLREVGLDKVAAKIPETGELSFVWTADTARPIRRCRIWAADTGCVYWYDPKDVLGHNAVIAPADRPALRSHSGDVWHVPQQCQPNQCAGSWNRQPGVISLCKDPKRSEPNVCIADAVLGMWQAPGIYRSLPLAGDRLFAFDLSKLQ